MKKLLKDLVAGLSVEWVGPSDIVVDDIVFDSRRVRTGCLFVALRGAHVDGHDFIKSAVASGARAVLCERRVDVKGVTLALVRDALQALAPVAARFWDAPSQKLLTVGITGTNGKTTVSFLVESIFKAAGLNPGVLGTINYRFLNESTPAPNTTPFASELQRFLAHIVEEGGKSCVMEVSSHALALGRVSGVDFDVAVLTNVTQDHLDFHQTLEAYAQSKLELFRTLTPKSASPDKPFPRRAVVYSDDPLYERVRSISRVPVLSYRLRGPADVFAKNVECNASGSRFQLCLAQQVVPVRLALLGEFNVLNALAAAAVGLSQNIAMASIVQGLESLPGVPGRMERVGAGQPFGVIVDYAHTEDALRSVLRTLRQMRPKRLLTVFGCGGDRDRLKRPLMGEVAARLSDEVIITSDNPRSEDPQRITLDVEVGVRRVRPDHYQIVVDRAEAIAQALAMAQPGDLVLLAGKGHENYQILADKTIPFDDREVVRRLLASTVTQ
jgi:UDP-N-acetylmuramyl-tripeptide synthetase